MQGQQPNCGKKILDEVREVMRLHHHAIHAERSYCDWIRRFALYHRMQSRDDMVNGEQKIEAFLTHLAVDGNVVPRKRSSGLVIPRHDRDQAPAVAFGEFPRRKAPDDAFFVLPIFFSLLRAAH